MSYNNNYRYAKNSYSRPAKKKRGGIKKSTVYQILFIVLAVTLVAGVFVGLTSIYGQPTKQIHPGFSIGSIDEVTGKYVEGNGSLYTKKAFECKGLIVKLAYDSNIEYQIFYYDSLENYISATTVSADSAKIEVPEEASLARIVITPVWNEDVDDEDKVIGNFDILKYTKQINLYVARQQNPNEDVKIYVVPGDKWNKDGSTIGAWCWSSSSTPLGKFIEATDKNGDGVLEIIIPEGYTNFNLVDLYCGATVLGVEWANVREQTEDLALPTNSNVYYHVYASTWSNSSELLEVEEEIIVNQDYESVFFNPTEHEGWEEYTSFGLYRFDKTGVEPASFLLFTKTGDSQYTATFSPGYTHFIIVAFDEEADLSDNTTITFDDVVAQSPDLTLQDQEW